MYAQLKLRIHCFMIPERLVMTMANEQIQMVMIAITDMAKAKAFYAEQLGF